MKKILYILIILMFVLIACSSNESTKTEEELRAEVRAEMEAESKLKEEANNETEQLSSEENNLEQPTVVDINNKEMLVDINNKEMLVDFIFENYEIDSSISHDDLLNELTFTYADFNDDNIQDVVCFSENVNSFYDVVFITVTNNAFEIIDNDLEKLGQYGHSISKESDFIIYRFSGGGSGIHVSAMRIYKYYNGKITYTGTNLDLKTDESNPPTKDYPDGYVMNSVGEIVDRSYKVGTQEDKWLAFEYTYTRTDGNTEEIVLKTADFYEYDSNTNTYNTYQIQEPIVNDSVVTADASPTDEAYKIEDLKLGQILEGFVVKNVTYGDLDAYIELEGESTLSGTLVMDYMTGSYAFITDERMLSYPIDSSVAFNGVKLDIYGPTYTYIGEDEISKLTETQRRYLDEKGLLDVTVTFTSFSFQLYKDSIIDIKDLKVTTEIDTNDSNFQNPQSSEYGKLEGFENETFTTDNQGDFYVDYSQYRCVIVPMHTSKNKHSNLEYKGVAFEGDNPTRVEFLVFGKLEDVKLNYIPNMGEEGQWINLEILNNSYVDIIVPMPNDMSTVVVTGKFHDSEGSYKDVKFTLDDMRDLSAYDIILFE